MRETDVHEGTARTGVRRHVVHLEQEFGHCDITPELRDTVRDAGVRHGVAVASVVGSTAAVTTIEYEPGALADLRKALERLAPPAWEYEHNARWGDGNGFSHLRSALLKTSVSIPVVDGTPTLGTWQQLVVLNLDTRERAREVVIAVTGV